ncbi:MAG: o-succinylbenzoate synthase [Bacteroidota bacterium]|nr:o-succinylbenzoate synthase [Bacteroidota bacterium]
MNIERITLTHVRIPLVEPFTISNGSVREKDGIIVRVFSDGLVGVGEASPMAGSFYSEETPESTWGCLVHRIIPMLFASKPVSLDDVNILFHKIHGDTFAKAGIETALRDIEAQKQDSPLYKLLGGKRRDVESGLAVGIYSTVDQLVSTIERYLPEGYKRVKIKIQPGWDATPLRAVKKCFGNIPLMVDANGAYSHDDLEHLCSLDEFELMMIEQPFSKDDFDAHAQLQAMMRTPICLDEGACDCSAIEKAASKKSCRIVNIKIQRVGGLTQAEAMHAVCAEKAIPVWAGTMPELGVGAAQTLHLATLDNFLFPTDVESSRRWFVDDIIEPMLEVHNGVIEIPDGIGNCFQLNERKVLQYKVREEIFQ